MKKLIFLILLFKISSVSAQEINWKNFSVGILAEQQINSGDWEKYWNNTIGLGGTINYILTDELFIEGSIIYSSFKVKNNLEEKYPEFKYLKIPAGLCYNSSLFKKVNIRVRGGLVNNTFMFEGKAAEKISENQTESEMGIYIGCGVVLYHSLFDLEVYFTFQNIFSDPENLKSLSVGGKILF